MKILLEWSRKGWVTATIMDEFGPVGSANAASKEEAVRKVKEKHDDDLAEYEIVEMNPPEKKSWK